jgi:hypothetical protein
MTVSAQEFMRRFLTHTLPPGFQRIRHFGFLANCHRQAKLELCRQLLAVPILALLPQPGPCRQLLDTMLETPIPRCPHCGIGVMIRIAILPRYPWPPHHRWTAPDKRCACPLLLQHPACAAAPARSVPLAAKNTPILMSSFQIAT